MVDGGQEWVVATAREVRAAVRAQLAEQMARRQKAALSVASAYAKVEKARERLAAAESQASTALATATKTVSLGELVTLTGVPAAELRRLTRESKQQAPAQASAPVAAVTETAAPAPEASTSTVAPQPVAAAS